MLISYYDMVIEGDDVPHVDLMCTDAHKHVRYQHIP